MESFPHLGANQFSSDWGEQPAGQDLGPSNPAFPEAFPPPTRVGLSENDWFEGQHLL